MKNKRPPIIATPATAPITMPAMAPPDNASPDEEGDEEGDAVAAGAVGVWAVLEVVGLDIDVVLVEEAEVVVVAVESTLNESIGLLAFLLKMCVA
jgi:hypothetical protein